MFKVIKSPRDMTTSTIIQRILANHEAYKVQMSVSFSLCDMSLVVNGGQNLCHIMYITVVQFGPQLSFPFCLLYSVFFLLFFPQCGLFCCLFFPSISLCLPLLWCWVQLSIMDESSHCFQTCDRNSVAVLSMMCRSEMKRRWRVRIIITNQKYM